MANPRYFADPMMAIARQYRSQAVSIETGQALSAPVDMRWFSGVIVHIPAVWTAANLGLLTSETELGTYNILRDESGTPVQVSGILTTGARAYSLPVEAFPCGWEKRWRWNGATTRPILTWAA